MGTEHILLALLRETDATAAEVLSSFGVTYPLVHAAVIRMMGVGVHQAAVELSFTGQAQDVVEGEEVARRAEDALPTVGAIDHVVDVTAGSDARDSGHGGMIMAEAAK